MFKYFSKAQFASSIKLIGVFQKQSPDELIDENYLKLIGTCWEPDPKERPTFSRNIKRIKEGFHG